jgi:CBS-domain-containing membrane protein
MSDVQLSLEAHVKLAVQHMVRAIVAEKKAWKAEDRAILTAAVWDAIGAEAKTQSEDAWNKMLKDAIYAEPVRTEPTNKLVGVTPHFEVHAKVTEPIKRFNIAKLGEILIKSKYKIPVHQTVAFVDQSKTGDKGNLLLSIVTKGK